MTTTSSLQFHEPRYDIYRPIHKALRSFMSDTLSRVGRLDLDDAGERDRTLAQVDALLTFCAKHIQHENDFVHAAIDARLPAGAERTRDDHAEHVACIDALRDELRSLPKADAEQQPALALRLYRHLALFVAEHFQHMHIEETDNNAALWAHYSDAELVDVHPRLLAGLSPFEHLEVARWMIPALTRPSARRSSRGCEAKRRRTPSSESSTRSARTSTRATGPSWHAPSASPCRRPRAGPTRARQPPS